MRWFARVAGALITSIALLVVTAGLRAADWPGVVKITATFPLVILWSATILEIMPFRAHVGPMWLGIFGMLACFSVALVVSAGN